jgi:5-methylcytosine-specific restriction protein A
MPTIYLPRRPKQGRTNKLSERYKRRREVYNTKQWRDLAALQLGKHPTCQLCAEQGRVTPAVDVHHVRSFTDISDPGERHRVAFDPHNLLSLCKECHATLHNKARGSEVVVSNPATTTQE